MKNLNNDVEKMANGIAYCIGMVAVFLIMFFAACHILNSIIDPCLAMLESLAENTLRMGTALMKIFLVSVFVIAIYKVFIEAQNES